MPKTVRPTASGTKPPIHPECGDFRDHWSPFHLRDHQWPAQRPPWPRSHAGWQTTFQPTSHSAVKSTYRQADHQTTSGPVIQVVLVTDGLTRSGEITTSHLPTSGGVLSIVVTAERRYGPCWPCVNNNNMLDVRQSLCATVGDRTFAIAGARLWNSLPPDIIACDTVSRFRRELKTFLFRQSYPSIVF